MNCTEKKDESRQLLPAYKRYLESPSFRTFWKNVYDLPVDVKMLSAKFGMIEWYTPIPFYNQKMADEDVPRFVEEVKDKIELYDKVFFIGLGPYRRVAEMNSPASKCVPRIIVAAFSPHYAFDGFAPGEGQHHSRSCSMRARA